MSSIYSDLYDVMSENMIAAGKEFPYKKTTFLCDAGSHPQNVDVSRYLNLANDEFMEAVYTAALKRLPDERTRKFWQDKNGLSPKEFQREVLQSIANSSVVAVNHIHLVNNPYFEQKCGLRYRMLGALYGLTDKSSLREFGKKMPQPVQKIIRKVFL